MQPDLRVEHLRFVATVMAHGMRVENGSIIKEDKMEQCEVCRRVMEMREMMNRRTKNGNHWFCCVEHYRLWLEENAP